MYIDPEIQVCCSSIMYIYKICLEILVRRTIVQDMNLVAQQTFSERNNPVFYSLFMDLNMLKVTRRIEN